MATLSSYYQYLGRSSAMQSQNGSYYYYLLLYGKAEQVGTSNMYDVSIKTVLACTSGASFYGYYSTSHSGEIDGTSAISISSSVPNSEWELSNFSEDGYSYKKGTVIGEGSTYVSTNGTETQITLSATYKFSATGTTYTPTSGTSRTVTIYDATLPATIIAIHPTLTSAPDFTDEDRPTITYLNSSGDALTALTASIGWGGKEDNIAYRAVSMTNGSYTFILTDAEKQSLIDACSEYGSLSVTFYLKSRIGYDISTSKLTRTFTIAGANPIVRGTVVDTNTETIELTGDSSKLVRYHSNAKATMTAEAQKGAAIYEDMLIIRNGNATGYGYTHTFNKVESNVFAFFAEDSRGYIGSATVTPEMVNYVKLTCNITKTSLDLQGNLTVTCKGNYFNNTFGVVENTLSVQCRYKDYTGVYSKWQDMTLTKSGNAYSATASLSGLDSGLSYSVETRAVDELTDVTATKSGITNKPTFYWSKDEFVFEVPVTFNQGATINTDQVVKSGVWLPALNPSAISIYTTRCGWYSQIQTVTVGFYIKATCNSGYEGESISISGLPFTPSYSAAGGGMCSGAYVSGGFNFQCFVVEEDGAITTRVQACNNTTATNLSTSATGCRYPSGGGEITLSGTITFLAEKES